MEVRGCPTEFGSEISGNFFSLRCTSYAKIKTTSATIIAANLIRDSNIWHRVARESALFMLQTRPTRFWGTVSTSSPNCNWLDVHYTSILDRNFSFLYTPRVPCTPPSSVIPAHRRVDPHASKTLASAYMQTIMPRKISKKVATESERTVAETDSS